MRTRSEGRNVAAGRSVGEAVADWRGIGVVDLATVGENAATLGRAVGERAGAPLWIAEQAPEAKKLTKTAERPNVLSKSFTVFPRVLKTSTWFS
jgi:hypothetical protein